MSILCLACHIQVQLVKAVCKILISFDKGRWQHCVDLAKLVLWLKPVGPKRIPIHNLRTPVFLI